jgi:superfamily II DNA or RNA helicase
VKLERTTTGLIIHQASPEIKRAVLRYFSLTNPVREYFIYSGNDRSKKPLFGKEHDVIYISSGFLDIVDEDIKRLPKPTVINYPTPKKVEITMNREPRSQLQEDCIHQMLTTKASKITIELKPGVGKTFIATYATSKIQMKPLVIAPTTLLKNQWVEEFEGCGIPREDIATRIWDAPDKKLCVVTISSIELDLGKDWEKLMKVINDSSFGIKIVDEAHLHLKGVLKLDAICNIKHNWYLSATLGRSDELEDKILNRALLDAERFVGSAKYEEYQKEFVTCYFQDIYYNPSNKLCNEHFKYGTKGLIKATYYRMLLDYQHGIPFMNNIKRLIRIAYNIKTYEGKILVLVPLLDVIDRLKNEVSQDPWFNKFNIVTVDGSLPLAVKRKALEDGDLILTTTMSVGTGTDIKNLACVINFDQVASPITFEQTFGRLRDRGKECWYFDVADHVKQAKSFESWGRKRRSILPYFPGVKPDMKVLPPIKC